MIGFILRERIKSNGTGGMITIAEWQPEFIYLNADLVLNIEIV